MKKHVASRHMVSDMCHIVIYVSHSGEYEETCRIPSHGELYVSHSGEYEETCRIPSHGEL